jgi:hypothetical protein
MVGSAALADEQVNRTHVIAYSRWHRHNTSAYGSGLRQGSQKEPVVQGVWFESKDLCSGIGRTCEYQCRVPHVGSDIENVASAEELGPGRCDQVEGVLEVPLVSKVSPKKEAGQGGLIEQPIPPNGS